MKALISLTAALGVAALALLVPVTSAYAAAQTTNATAVSKVLQEVKMHASEAVYDADFLDASARAKVTWHSYGLSLNEINLHLRDLAEDFSRLQTMRDQATPKQREAIDRLEPLIQEMRNHLTTTIRNLNANQEQVNFPWFHSRIHADYVAINKVYKLLCECTAKDNSEG